MHATADLYHRDFHAWISGQAALLRQGRVQEIDPQLLAEELEAMGRRGAVAVLLYHGLSSSENGEVLPVARLREQLAGLKQAGFRFIAAHELPAYFARCAKLAATLLLSPPASALVM